MPGLPFLDAVKFFFIGDGGTRAAAFKAGRLDILGVGATSVNTIILKELKASVPDLAENTFISLEIAALYFNTDRPPWDDVRVRRAAFLSFDHNLALTVLPEHVQIAGMPVVPGWGLPVSELIKMPGYRKGAELEADRAEARKLLADAGFPDGLDVDAVIVSGTDYNLTYWQFLQDQLKQVGIRATGGQVPGAEHSERKLKGDFTLNVDSPALNYADPNGAIDAILVGEFVQLEDAQTSDLFAMQRAETDAAKRRQLVLQLEARMFETMSQAPASWLGSFWPSRPDVKGFTAALGHWGNVSWDHVWLDR